MDASCLLKVVWITNQQKHHRHKKIPFGGQAVTVVTDGGLWSRMSPKKQTRRV
jgi:hypothetical protein